MDNEVGLEHHLVQLTVLGQVVPLVRRQVHPPVGQQRFDLFDILVVREEDRRHSHEFSEYSGGCDAVREGREFDFFSDKELVVEVL
jgi:hypothetical protein